MPGGSKCRPTSTSAPSAARASRRCRSSPTTPLTECPSCEGRLKKVFSAVGIVFKGSGFYRNDSRGSSSSSSRSKAARPRRQRLVVLVDSSSVGLVLVGLLVVLVRRSSARSSTSSSASCRRPRRRFLAASLPPPGRRQGASPAAPPAAAGGSRSRREACRLGCSDMARQQQRRDRRHRRLGPLLLPRRCDRDHVDTPYGAPSDSLFLGEIAGRRVAFLPRHGREHHLPPHRINYRANLWALRVGRGAAGARPVRGGRAAAGVRAGDTARAGPARGPHEGAYADLLRRGAAAGRAVPNVVHVTFADPYCPVGRQVAVAAARGRGWEPSTAGRWSWSRGRASPPGRSRGGMRRRAGRWWA